MGSPQSVNMTSGAVTTHKTFSGVRTPTKPCYCSRTLTKTQNGAVLIPVSTRYVLMCRIFWVCWLLPYCVQSYQQKQPVEHYQHLLWKIRRLPYKDIEMIQDVSSYCDSFDKDGYCQKMPVFYPFVGSLTTYRLVSLYIYNCILSVQLTNFLFLHLLPPILMHFMPIHDRNRVLQFFICCSGFTACALGNSSVLSALCGRPRKSCEALWQFQGVMLRLACSSRNKQKKLIYPILQM